MLHIATHGIYRSDNPMFSGIRLGDGYVNLYDLYQLRLNAKLVTLSGCATGMNFVAAGDELLGLQRGLFYAGATTLLLSLWDVHDRSTAELMQEFYRSYIQNGDAARLSARRDAHPKAGKSSSLLLGPVRACRENHYKNNRLAILSASASCVEVEFRKFIFASLYLSDPRSPLFNRRELTPPVAGAA